VSFNPFDIMVETTFATILAIILGSIPTGMGLGFSSEFGKDIYHYLKVRYQAHKNKLLGKIKRSEHNEGIYRNP
jgi:hypothetical protein